MLKAVHVPLSVVPAPGEREARNPDLYTLGSAAVFMGDATERRPQTPDMHALVCKSRNTLKYNAVAAWNVHLYKMSHRRYPGSTSDHRLHEVDGAGKRLARRIGPTRRV